MNLTPITNADVQETDCEKVQVSFVRTIVGWFNLYLPGTSYRVTLKPDEFKAMFPDASSRTRCGCDEIFRFEAEHYFGAEAMKGVLVA